MATYKYTAISKDGVKVSGVVEGFNEFDAVDRIKQDCDIVLKLTEVEEKKPGLLSMEIGGNRLNAKAFSLMCAQFSIILQSGIPIGRTVRLIGDKMTDKKLKGILRERTVAPLQFYSEDYRKTILPDGAIALTGQGSPLTEGDAVPAGTDVEAVLKGYISIGKVKCAVM